MKKKNTLKKKDPFAVALGRRRAKTLTPEHQSEAAAARWGVDPNQPRCACGCGDTLARALKRHPKRARMQ